MSKCGCFYEVLNDVPATEYMTEQNEQNQLNWTVYTKRNHIYEKRTLPFKL